MQIYVNSIGDSRYKDINPMNLGESRCKPNHFDGPGYRDYWVMHYVVSGKGVFVYDNQVYNLSAGDCFIIKPKELYFYQADEKEPWHYIWFCFEAFVDLPVIMKNSHVIHSHEIGNIFVTTIKEIKNTTSKISYFNSQFWRLITVFEEMEGKNYSPNYVEIAKSYIENEYSKDVKIREIAVRLRLDRTYFSTLFKKETGISPQQYLTEMRLSRAKDLMANYNLSPSVVATAVGYSDIFSFSRMFKRHFGISPTEYICSNEKSEIKNM